MQLPALAHELFIDVLDVEVQGLSGIRMLRHHVVKGVLHHTGGHVVAGHRRNAGGILKLSQEALQLRVAPGKLL